MDEQDRGWSVWRRAWMVVGIASACLAFLLWHPATVVGSALVGATLAVIVVLLQRIDPHHLPHPGSHAHDQRTDELMAGASAQRTHRAHSVRRAAVGGALGALTLGALGTVSLGLLFFVGSVAALTTPPCLSFWRSRLSHPAPAYDAGASSATGVPEALPRMRLDRLDARPVSALSDTELCIAWRRSFGALLDARSPEEKQAVVTLRQAYLDEMEARDAVGFGAWLESGARAAGGPERFWTTRQGDPQDPPYAA